MAFKGLHWLKNFLSNRNFQVKINQSLSDLSESINKGVAQGTSLAPLLFNVFVADILDQWTNNEIEVKSYADDIIAYIIYQDFHKTYYSQKFIGYFLSKMDRKFLTLINYMSYTRTYK